tara:strand:- start:334 stop:1260 length:927 start_codon:yes stop_codon:yes gene_type:complete
VSIDKNFYNQASSAKLGWDPSWFGECCCFDEELVVAVKKWQRKARLTADGLVGPMTYRRIWTERESLITSDTLHSNFTTVSSNNHIVHNGNHYPIDWDAVILWNDENGLKTKSGQYYSFAGKPDRKPTMFVNHWDVCLSSKSCANVLAKRGISIHFCIDNDGTIYQLLDTQHGAWHAGGRSWNMDSIGVEISDAYYPKYQDTYVKRGFDPRPVWSGKTCHGSNLKDFLGFYPVQLEALKALWKAVHRIHGIPLECPTDDDGNLVTTVDPRCTKNEFSGFVNHFNLTRKKIDCAGLDLVGLLDQVKVTL